MTEFTLDTSGKVPAYYVERRTGTVSAWRWKDLDLFTQGYVEALFESLSVDLHTDWLDRVDPYRSPGFSDLARKTLAAILKDCAEFQNPKLGAPDWAVFNVETGRDFWRDRQGQQLTRHSSARFPPLTVYLGDDGLVLFQ